MPEQAHKRCRKCGEAKPFDDFYRDRRAPDGRQSYCAACAKAAVAATDKANPQRHSQRVRRSRARHPEKDRARRAVVKAVDRGRLVKPECCEDCGNPTAKRQLHGHHQDYSKPLDVEWLCSSCHGQRHRE